MCVYHIVSFTSLRTVSRLCVCVREDDGDDGDDGDEDEDDDDDDDDGDEEEDMPIQEIGVAAVADNG